MNVNANTNANAIPSNVGIDFAPRDSQRTLLL